MWNDHPLITGIVGSIIAAILFAGCIFICNKIRINMNDNNQPYIAVVISDEAIDFDLSKEFNDGFNAAKQFREYIHSKIGKRIYIKHEETRLDEGIESRLLKKLSLDKKCILVIGNSNSNLSNNALDIILDSEDKLPYIMPIATDINLIEKAAKNNHDAVLRMVPDNGEQAKTLSKLVFSDKVLPKNIKRKVAIYIDEENSSYSINLSKDIANRIRNENKNASIVIEESFGANTSFYNTLKQWDDPLLAPNIIIYVGVAHNGFLLIDKMCERVSPIPIIFTDGCLSAKIITNSQKLLGKKFILSPVKYMEEELFIPTYKPIGADTYFLVSKIIDECKTCSRSEVRDYIKLNKKNITIENGRAGNYGFNDDGNNTKMVYLVYEISGSKFILINNY